MAANDNIEERTKKIVNSKVEDGEEFQKFQEAQNQLLNIQAAQKENIQVNRAISSAQNQNTQSMAQAAEIMANEENTNQGLNPQTKSILEKYGYRGPNTASTTSTNSSYGGPVQGRGIIINNKTENKTTNNIQVSSPSYSQSKSGGLEKFKSWISGSLARQKAQDEIRERNFNRKEWSLSRSSSKIMNKIEEVGKTIGERMDPRKVANVLMDQFKVLMFLLGFQFISKNWKNILHTVANIEKWIKGTAEYFGIGTKNGIKFLPGRSKFVKDLISFLGGDPEGKDGALTVLKNLFKDSIKLLGKRLDLFFQDRAEAVKAISFPSINPEDGVIGALQSLGVYLGDILSAIVGGRYGIVSNIKSSIKALGRSEAMGAEKMGWMKGTTRYMDASKFSSNSQLKNTDLGDVSSLMDNVMSGYDYDSSGRLANSMSSSMIQSNSISEMIKDDDSGRVNTVGVMTGLENLQESAKRFGKTLVSEEFINSLRELIPNFHINIPQGVYKFIKVKKTDKDYSDEGADPFLESGKSFFRRAGLNAFKNATGATGVISDSFDTMISGDMIKDPAWQAFKSGVKSTIKKANSNDYTLKMVPGTDPRPGVVIPYKDYKTGKIMNKKFFKLYELSPDRLETIRNRLAIELKNPDFEFDTSSRSSMETIDKRLRELKNKKLSKGGVNWEGVSREYLRQNITSDFDKIKDKYSKLDEYDRNHEDREKRWKDELKDSQVGRVADNIADQMDRVEDWMEGAYSSITGNMTERQFIKQFRPLYKKELEKQGFDSMYADALVAQSGLESGWGKSKLSKKYYNFGGIKASRGERSINMSTDEYDLSTGKYGKERANFVVFKSPEDYVRYHVNKLNRKWDAFGGNSIDDFINRIIGGKVKYATDPNYGSKLANIIYGIKDKVPEEYDDSEENKKKVYAKVQMKNTPVNPKPVKPKVVSSPASKNLKREGIKIEIPKGKDDKLSPIKPRDVDLSKPIWRTVASIDNFYMNDAASKVKGSSSDSDGILEELKSMNKGISIQGRSLAMLSNSVNELAVIAASNGNNTTVINNNDSGNKKSDGTFTKGPNDWVNRGAFDISCS